VGVLIDNAFDLDALVLEDLPFAAYYELVSVITPPVTEPPRVGGAVPRSRRQRRRDRREMHLAMRILLEDIEIEELILAGVL
jgi:hypothetical protein